MQDDSASMSDKPDMPIIRIPRHCGRFLDGHDVHHIRARLALTNATWELVDDLTVNGQWIEFTAGGRAWRGWNHDVEYVGQLIGVFVPVEWCERYKLLRFAEKNGWRLVGVAETADPEGCTGNRTDGGYIALNRDDAEDQLRHIVQASERNGREEGDN